ncbi:methyltransferase domain-containing protein [Cupriavidus necator]
MNTTDISTIARQVKSFCGPGRALDVGRSPGAVLDALRNSGFDGVAFEPACMNDAAVVSGHVLPFDSEAFDTVVATNCLEHLQPADLGAMLNELRRVSRRNLLLRVPTSQSGAGGMTPASAGSRAWWETACFAAGWRKHPCYYLATDYASLQHDDAWVVITLEKVPEAAWERYPIECLREERDLHMDMLREAGSRSDAHVYRYQLASRFVRQGDVVLDAACGLGYGSHLIWSGTKASKVIGIDGSEYAAKYAACNFVPDGAALEFREGFLPQCLHAIPDNSVDVVISFETLEHVEDPQGLLAEFRRILTPGGRFIGSVPNDWSDESGEDPNPFHLHVYTLGKFRQQLRADFSIEVLFSQTADRVKKLDARCEWVSRPRSIVELADVDADPIEAEWWLCVAMKDPNAGSDVPYVERNFTEGDLEAAGNALAFGRDYENPWLVRSMVSMGLRTESTQLQLQWSRKVLNVTTRGSADQGAALAILAYRVLDKRAELDIDIEKAIEAYIATPPANPNAHRWVISLRYVLALLRLQSGQRDAARVLFEETLRDDPVMYSITLLTKTVDAAWLLGYMHLADGDWRTARKVWQTTAVSTLHTVGGFLVSLGSDYDPPSFEPREITFVVDKAQRLLAAARGADYAKWRPAVYQADVDRGENALLIRSDSIARERDQLRNELQDLRTYLDAVLEGKLWLEDNRTRTLAYVDELKGMIHELESKAAALKSENDGLRSEVSSNKKWSSFAPKK